MKESIKHQCILCKIIGRSLKAAYKSIGRKVPQRFGPKDWVNVCPICDSFILGLDTQTPLPFLCADGVMRVVTDYDTTLMKPIGEVFSFGGFEFSKNALMSSVELLKQEDKIGAEVEAMGQTFLNSPTPERALKFCRKVCEWGRGQRVYGNLIRHHGKDKLGLLICDWLVKAKYLPPQEAIEIGENIKGLRVSFASKHLRMAMPHRFGVLDEVISLGLGFAANKAGYKLFHSMLTTFQVEHVPTLSIAQIESGLFMLIRQSVRAIDRDE